MKNNYIITTSSTCDLSKDYLQKNNILYTSFNYILDDEKFKDNFYQDITPKEFFDSLSYHTAKTSQPSPQDYVALWENYVKEGFDIVHIELSKGLSGAYDSSLIAKDILLEKYHNSKIYVIDSLSGSSGIGLLVMMANEKKEQGFTSEEVFNYISDNVINVNHIVYCSDLTQLFKGGRLKKTSYRLATLLNIMPIIYVDKNGELKPLKNVRGHKNTINEVVKIAKSNAKNGNNYDYKFLISHADCYDKALDLMNALKEVFKNADISENNIFNIGTVIGSHVGKGTVVLFYVGNGRLF